MQSQTANADKPIQQLLDELIQTHQVEPQQLLICLEHTGIYNHHLLDAFSQSTYSVWLESGKQIRYSMGVQRGKTDAVDALNIARYAWKNQRECRLWRPQSELLTQLKKLFELLLHIKKLAERSELYFLSRINKYAHLCQLFYMK